MRLVYRRPRAADCRPLSVFPPVRGRHPSLWLVLTVRCQHAPSQHVSVHPRRCEVDVQQQAAVERTEDRVHLVRFCTPSPSHSQWRRTSRPRLSSSGAVSQRPWCVRRRRLDNEDSHHSRTVVMLQINHAVSVFTCAKCSRHCSGSQPVGLLQCCFR